MRPVLPLWAVLACATVLTTGEDIRERDVSSPRPVGGAPQDAGASRRRDYTYDYTMYLMELLDNNENIKAPSSIEETLRLLKKGEEEIVLKDEYRDLVLLLGNTGAGKTASTIWIAADDDELFSVESSRGQFLIKDRHGKIGNSTITSTTIFPDFVLNKKTDTGHYDLPGFSDTRSSSYDIANGYFIKKVIDHSNSTKLVVVVSYPSVRQGVDRQDFMKLLKHITELVKTIVKYKNSISMIVTKVDNIYIETENGLKLLDDKAVNEGIAIFLREVKGDLEHNLNLPNITDKDKIFYKNGLDLIDILLVQEGELYPQIGLFRRPNKDGPLKDIPILQKQKVQVQEYIHQKLVFTQTNKEDFGHTISDKSQNDINDLADEIYRNVISIVKQIANSTHMYQKDLIRTIQDKINKFVITETNSDDVKFKEIQILFNKLNNGQSSISKLADEIKKNVKTPKSLAAAINRTLNDLNIGASTNNVSEIVLQEKYISFLQEVSGKDLSKNANPLAWASPFQTITTELAGPIDDIIKSLTKIENKIHDTIRSNIKKSVQEMRNYFINKERDISDINNLQMEYNMTYKKLLEIQQKGNSDTPMDYLQRLTNNITGMNIRFSNHSKMNIVQNSVYFKYLKTTMDIELNYLNDSQYWYKFVDNVYDQLSNYEIQKDTKVCSDLANEITHADEGKKVADTSIKFFLKKCHNIGYEQEYNNVKNITLDKYKIRSLEKVFTLTLKSTYSYKCETNGKLAIKGIYVKISDVADKACAEPTKLIEIFALNKIFIDSNLNQTGKKVKVSIIAPVLDVQGDYQLLLDGALGKNHSKDTAEHGIGPGKSGDDGIPGLPGGPGGNFLGIMDQVNHGSKLTVVTDGGKGGRGQNAGNGDKGANGGIPTLDLSKKSGFIWEGINWDLRKEGSNWISLGYVALQSNPIPASPGNSLIYSYYYVYGTNCTSGGSGGNAGYGGKGGKPGIVNIIPVSNETNINISNSTGLVGDSASGGRGAVGGSIGRHITVLQSLDSFFPYMWASYKIVNQYGLHGCEKGIDGNKTNDCNTTRPENTTFLHQSLIVNDFKVYLRENIVSTMKENVLREFHNKLENSTSVQDLYELRGFYDELIGLETQYYNLHNKISFLPFYHSLLSRVDKYIEKKLVGKDDAQNKLVLHYLRVACMSKISSIKNNLENYFVLDTTGYFKLVGKNIEEYKRALKEVKIDTYEKQYHSMIVTEIKKANELIDTVVYPELDKVYAEMDSGIQALIQDILKEINKTEESREELVKLQQKMANQVLGKALLGFVKFGSQFLAFAGPEGALAAGAIGKGIDALGNIIFDETEIPVVDSAKNSINQVLNYYKNERICLKNNLGFVIENISQNITSENTEDLQKLLAIVNPLWILLNKNNIQEKDYVDEKVRTQKELQTYIDDLRKLSPKGNLYSVVNSDGDADGGGDDKEEEKESIKWGTATKNTITLAEVGFDFIKNMNKHRKLMSSVTDAMKKIENKIKQLKEYEQLIYNVLIPMRLNFQNKLKGNHTNESHAALDISKWRIQNSIKDFQVNMEYMVQSSDAIVKLKLMATIDKVQYGMLTMISIYDRIQDYYDKVKLAKYIADLNSGTVIEGGEFKTYINKLEAISKSNLVLQQFDKATFAFKIYMFPFVGLYLDQFELRPDLQSNNISNLMYNAMKQLNFLSDELIIKATVIKAKKYRLFPDISFEHTNYQLAPFYVWKHETYGGEIAKLLHGHKLTFKADITKGLNRNAIKFKEIGVKFLLKNESLQNELDNYLADYMVEIIHLGDSHYRCDDMYFVIPHNVISMKHSVNKDEDGKHYYHLEEDTATVRNNPSMCSPYATWELKIVNKDINMTDTFNNLKKFVGETMDLALEGWGQYVELGLDVCNDNLMKHYQIDKTLL